MELAVQQYLRSGKSLDDLERELAVTHHIAGPLAALNYRAYLADFQQPICRECRALILERDTWQVVSRSFPKFFNLGELEGADLESRFDWENYQVEEKLDGSLFCLFSYRDAWRMATRSQIDAVGNTPDRTRTFADLFHMTLRQMGLTWESLTEALSPDIFYSFELTSPENQVVVRYPDYRLTWIGAWSQATLDEIPIETLPDLPVPRIRVFPLRTLSQLMETVKTLNPSEQEGFVLKDRAGGRLKIKSPTYLRAAHLSGERGNLSFRQLYLWAADPQTDDLMPYLPETLQKQLQDIRTLLGRFRQAALEAYDRYHAIPDQKAFAEAIVDHPLKTLLFRMRKGKSIDDAISDLQTDTLLRLLQNFEEWVTVEYERKS